MSTETPSTLTASTPTGSAGPDTRGTAEQTGTDPWAPTAEQQPVPSEAPHPAAAEQQSIPVEAPHPAAAEQQLAQPYGTPVAGYAGYPSAAPVAATPGFSITSLVLGVASIFFGLTFIAPIAGLVFGILALKREPHGRTMAIWGIVLNAATLALSAIIILMVLVFALGVPFFALADPNAFS